MSEERADYEFEREGAERARVIVQKREETGLPEPSRQSVRKGDFYIESEVFQSHEILKAGTKYLEYVDGGNPVRMGYFHLSGIFVGIRDEGKIVTVAVTDDLLVDRTLFNLLKSKS